jgi:hypothetical protein
MGTFFIDTSTGQIATGRQLLESGVADPIDGPAAPWFRIQGGSDATTLWYAVMRKKTKGVFIGALCIRHSDHHASLLEMGWEEIPHDAISAPAF